jgi:hypothetical protein
MKKRFILALILGNFQMLLAQDTAKIAKPMSFKKVDNYTIQRLIILKNKKEILMEKGRGGWMTPALRSNLDQSLMEGLDSLAALIGISIGKSTLSGVYTYKFKDLPDHKEVSYRTHYTAAYKNGTLIQPTDTARIYKWVPIEDALKLIENAALKAETTQIIRHPKTLWGGSFLYQYKNGTLDSIKVVEPFYPLR